MKNKRIISIILSILLVSMASYTVFAAIPAYDSEKPYFEIESKEVEKGEIFEINVNIGNNPGFWAAKFSIKCDSAFSFVTENNEPVVKSATIDNAEFEYNLKSNVLTCLINSEDSSNITYNGTILTLKFLASETVGIGDYKISFTNYSATNFIDYDAKQVSFTFANGVISLGKGYFFEAYKCSPKATGNGTLSTYNQTDLTPTGTLSSFQATTEGDSVSFTLSNIAAGTYKFFTYSRDYSTRGTFDVYVDNVLINTVDYIAEFAMYKREIGFFTIASDKDVTVKFSASGVIGSLYLMNFELEKINTNVTSTSNSNTTTMATVPTTTTTTTANPTTTKTTSMTTTGPATLDTSTAISISQVSKTSNWINGNYDLSTGAYVLSSVRVCVSKLIKVTPGRVYQFNTGYSDTNIKFLIRNYNSNGTFISSAGALSSGSTYSFGTSTAYITLGIYHVKDNVTNLLSMVNDKIIKPVVTDVSTTEGTTDTTTTTTTTTTVKSATTVTTNATTNNPTTSKVTAYKVSLNGVVTNVEVGKSYTLPNNEDNIVAYKDSNGKYYACGESVVIDSDIAFTSVELSIKTLNQASMRLNSLEDGNYVTGVRFYTELDQELITVLKNSGFTIELGTLIAPKNYFTTHNVNELKFGVDFGKPVNYVYVPYTSDKYYKDSSFSGIVGSISNIHDNHANWDFVGRGYAKVTFNGVEKIVYATGKDKLPERSIAYIAYRVKNDETYEWYNDEQKAIIDYYCTFYNEITNDPYLEDSFD